MATEITPTPKLDRESSKEFLKKVAQGLKKPVGLVPTPKLPEAQIKIKEYAHKWEK